MARRCTYSDLWRDTSIAVLSSRADALNLKLLVPQELPWVLNVFLRSDLIGLWDCIAFRGLLPPSLNVFVQGLEALSALCWWRRDCMLVAKEFD